MVKTIKDLNNSELKNKKVLVRVDFNVPLSKGTITDDTRIQAAIPTIRYLLNAEAKIILVSHMGRPKGLFVDELRLNPVAKKLSEILGSEVIKLDDCIGAEVENKINSLKAGQICLLENIRFYKEETDNDADFAKKLANFTDIYVNDAFGAAHRAHASTAGIASYVQTAVAGLLMEKEVTMLGDKLNNPERPFTAVIGGSKISSKIAVLQSLVKKVDTVIIGGGMAYTFIKARGGSIGKSICEDDQLDTARSILSLADENDTAIILPTDVLATDADVFGGSIDRDDSFATKIFPSNAIPADFEGMDSGPETNQRLAKLISQSKTVVWNGPLGVFEFRMMEEGTKSMALALELLTKNGGTTVVGGGDSVAAIEKFKLPKENFSHISTGGGASLEFLEGKILPGVDCLDKKSGEESIKTTDSDQVQSFADELANAAKK